MRSNGERERVIALMKLLVEDVIAARDRLTADDTQTARRNVVRVSLAAMEGMLWMSRQHVREVLSDLDELDPLADMALREQTYSVGENGRILAQQRSVPLPTAVRLVATQAQIICPALAVDFTVTGWANLNRSIAVRNRITHPKPENDLSVGNEDLRVVESGLSWLIATTDYIMASTNLSLVHHANQVQDVVDRLTAGNPDALAEYQRALASAG